MHEDLREALCKGTVILAVFGGIALMSWAYDLTSSVC